MIKSSHIFENFIDALATKDSSRLAELLTPDVNLREYGTQQYHMARGLPRVIDALRRGLTGAPDTRIELLNSLANDTRVAVEFRVQGTVGGRYLEEYCSAFLHLRDGQIHLIDLYRSYPIPSAHRSGWVAPPTITDAEIARLFDEGQFGRDPRELIYPAGYEGWWHQRLRGGRVVEDAHPQANWVANFRYPAEVADAKIEEIIGWHRARGLGFRWFVTPEDEPTDLAQRLERHGLMYAGDQWGMGRVGLDPTDIPTNPEVVIEVVDGSREELIWEMHQIIARTFNYTPEQTEQRWPAFREQLQNPKSHLNETQFLARLDGQAVGEASVQFILGLAYLGGASVLPEYRNRRVYSTLLARRLAEAHQRGYHLSTIHAEPMSQRVVARYGFKRYAHYLVYAWMPVPDMAVIRSLIPQD